MKKRILSVMSMAALTVSTSSSVFAYEYGPYLQAQIGMGGMYTSDKHLSEQTPIRDKDLRGQPNLRIALGAMIDNQDNNSSGCGAGVEIGYTDYSNNKYSATDQSGNTANLRYERQDWDLLGVLKNQVNDNTNLFGKLGVAYVQQKTKYTSDAAGGFDKVKKGFRPEVVVGAGYDLTKRFGMNISYTYIYGTKPKIPADASSVGPVSRIAPVNLVSLGFAYNF